MKQINEDLKQNNFKKAYLLFGEERYLRLQYRKRLEQALCTEGDTMNVHFYQGKDIPLGEIVDLAETLPFLSERRVIFISDSGLFKSGGDVLADYLTGTPCETTCFVFTETDVDKRSRLYKAVNSMGYAADFSIQDERTLKLWVLGALKKENKNISEKTLELFLSKTGTYMSNIQSELEKLLCYCMDRNVITDADVEATCSTQISTQIFDMINALGTGNQRQALDLYYDLLAQKEPPGRIMFQIGRMCNQLLLAKDMSARGYSTKDIAEKMGLPPFIATKYIKQSAPFKSSVLKNAIAKCVELETAFKSGELAPLLSVEILIMNLFSQ
ncbi:MAG: DNA polymerase III subunit delta [Lachnospiraceae bacterium]|nr:DNA polymerase III subunit delta [Lachnospiraceae bacterium]